MKLVPVVKKLPLLLTTISRGFRTTSVCNMRLVQFLNNGRQRLVIYCIYANNGTGICKFTCDRNLNRLC